MGGVTLRFCCACLIWFSVASGVVCGFSGFGWFVVI